MSNARRLNKKREPAEHCSSPPSSFFHHRILYDQVLCSFLPSLLQDAVLKPCVGLASDLPDLFMHRLPNTASLNLYPIFHLKSFHLSGCTQTHGKSRPLALTIVNAKSWPMSDVSANSEVVIDLNLSSPLTRDKNVVIFTLQPIQN